jgi:HPt (histidine-containing phosphotransfer) domain-containing protein
VTGDVPILDRRRFALLRQSGPETEDVSLAKLVRSFVSSSSATLDEIRRAAAAEGWLEVAELAHRLKGASALFGATRLRDTCDGLQEAARAGAHPAQLEVMLDRLASELEAARRAMERELEE